MALCPMKFNKPVDSNSDYLCENERCSWWFKPNNEHKGNCAILEISGVLYSSAILFFGSDEPHNNKTE